ncbi:MAG: flagellar protein FlaG [Candidatus Riflebacteria bacterium]|nr:flagellar protein FlaG [Candidatus Riflebacteria bacterium]
MEINNVRLPQIPASAPTYQPDSSNEPAGNEGGAVSQQTQEAPQTQQVQKPQEPARDIPGEVPSSDKEKDSKDSKAPTEKLNRAIDTANQTADAFDRTIKFQLHEKTKEYVISVIDTKTDKVIREIPPKEFLDMVAKMRDYIGMVFDKKA